MKRANPHPAVSLSDLQKNPAAMLDAAQGGAVVVLDDHSRTMAYIVPAITYEAMLERLDDLHLVELATERAGENGAPVDIDAL